MIQSLVQLFYDGPSSALVEAAEQALNSYLPSSPEALELSLLIGDSLRCQNNLERALSYYNRTALQRHVGAEMRVEALNRYIFLSQKVLDAYRKDFVLLEQMPPVVDGSQYKSFPQFDGISLKDRFFLLESFKVDVLANNVYYTESSLVPFLSKMKGVLARDGNIKHYLAEGKRICVLGDVHGSPMDVSTFYDLCMLKDVQLQCFQEVGDDRGSQFTMDLSSVYVFLGDYVDRGSRGLACVLFIYVLKYLYPRNVLLLRGNHECDAMNRIYGFTKEIYKYYGSHSPTYRAIQDTFAAIPYFFRLIYLPQSLCRALERFCNRVIPSASSSTRWTNSEIMCLASMVSSVTSWAGQAGATNEAKLDDLADSQEAHMLKCRLEEESLTIFCCHGGPPCVYTEYGRQLDLYLGIDSYENILQRSLTIVDPLAGELTWNDPAPHRFKSPSTLYEPSQRRLGYKYSYDLFRTWCKHTGVDLVLRGHEVALDGVHQDFQYAFEPKQLGGPNQELEYWFSVSTLRETPRHFTVFSSSFYEHLTNHGAAAIIRFEVPIDGVAPALVIRCFTLS